MRVLAGVVAAAAIAIALWQLHALSNGLEVTRSSVDGTPVTVTRERGSAAAPIVVIAHGFAGSQQLMLPFATTLARNGYIAVTFDFPGHGRNPHPLSGGLTDMQAMQNDLQATLASVIGYARALPRGDGRLAVLGHSMAADVVVRQASADPTISATVAVSLFLPSPHEFHPRNLLIIDGALEPDALREQGRVIIAAATGSPPEVGVTYGRFADGSARRLAFARGVEHVSVLYSEDSMREALEWFDQAFARHGDGFLDSRGHWIGLLLFGVILLAWPLASLLPRVSSARSRPAASWRVVAVIALAPAILTPLVLWRLPTQFLPLLLGDYIALHFALYGLLTLALITLYRRQLPIAPSPDLAVRSLVVATLAVSAYSLIALGIPLDTYVISVSPTRWRWPLIAAEMIAMLPYFIADEWLTRRLAARPFVYAATKILFLLSLAIAIALNVEKLFFLIIIVPLILVLFVVYGLFSTWIFRRTGHPLVAAVANAFVFAWLVAVTFPMVSR